MRLFVTALAVALVLASGAAFAATESWMGFLWNDQPIPGYTSAAADVDVGTNQMWINSGSGSSKTTFVPGSPGEKIGTVKLMGGFPIEKVFARVYDPRTTTNSGWVVYLVDDSNKWLGVGGCTWDATAYVTMREYNGSAWTKTNLCERGSTHSTNYFKTWINQNPDGTVHVMVDYYTNNGAQQGIVERDTTLSYGTFTQLYLWASTTSTDYKTYKWTDFNVPEPSSLLALAASLPMVGFALRRKRA